MSVLVAGVALNFVFSDTVTSPVSIAGALTRRRPRTKAEVPLRMTIAVIVVMAAVIAGFVFLSPLTYGSPGLDVKGVNRRRVLESWTLHFAK